MGMLQKKIKFTILPVYVRRDSVENGMKVFQFRPHEMIRNQFMDNMHLNSYKND